MLGAIDSILKFTVAVWLSASALVSINEVTLRRARVNTGMVTYFGEGDKQRRYVTSYPGQLSLAIPPLVGAMSNGDDFGHR